MKILIIGHSGGGKSTLAQKLSSHFKIPLLHLDKIAFEPNWQLRENKAIQQELTHFLAVNNNWVIDGVYSKHLFEERLEQADIIIYVNLNRFTSLYRMTKRYLQYRGKIRPSAPISCPETLDWRFLHFALFRSRRPERLKMYRNICQNYANKTVTVTNQKQIDVYTNYLLSKNSEPLFYPLHTLS